ncbi:MAG TPA: DUF502 domain-containing protein [Steroidobacteraceae bacterium]|nr:DUF502 domain-containing protein [Steroidobacteraceae bacterium]
MKQLWNLVLKGLAAILPISVTIYVVIWLGTSVEAVLRDLITLVLPERHYRPGLGLLFGFVLLVGAGLIVNAYVVRWFLSQWEQFLERIPLVKTVYGALRDLMKFLPAAGKRRDLQRVVLASFGEAHVIGFVTRESVPELALESAAEGVVAVYFPMSYQIGGYTLYMPRGRLRPLDLSVEEGMRLVLTGGISGEKPEQAGGRSKR